MSMVKTESNAKNNFLTYLRHFEDILMRLMLFYRGFLPFCISNSFGGTQRSILARHFNLVSEFKNRPIHHIDKGQDQCPRHIWGQFDKTKLSLRAQRSRSHRRHNTLGFKNMAMSQKLKYIFVCVETTYQMKR